MGGGVGRGDQGGCEPRIEVILKMQKKLGVGVRLGAGASLGGCEPTIEVIAKMQKKLGCMVGGGMSGGGGW